MRIAVVFAVLAALFAGGWLLFSGRDDSAGPEPYGSITERAVALAEEAKSVNTEWDRQEGSLPRDERNVLFRQTLTTLEEIRFRTDRLAAEVATLEPTSPNNAVATAVNLQLGRLQQSAQDMVDGLNAPRGEKEQRQAGLVAYLEAVDALSEIAPPAR